MYSREAVYRDRTEPYLCVCHVCFRAELGWVHSREADPRHRRVTFADRRLSGALFRASVHFTRRMRQGGVRACLGVDLGRWGSIGATLSGLP